MKTLVLGVGNTIRGDDGVGIFAVRSLRKQLDSPVDIKETQTAGLNILEMISGYNKAIIIDSIRTKEGKPGDVYRITQDRLEVDFKPCSSHKMGLATIIKLANSLGVVIPEEIMIYAIEIEKAGSFDDSLTLSARKAISKVVNLVKKELSL